MNCWRKIKKYIYIDAAVRKKYTDSALDFEYKTLVAFMRIVMIFSPIYGTIRYLYDTDQTKIEQIGFVSTFVYALFTYMCICYIRQKHDHLHIRAMRLLYSVAVFVYIYVIAALIADLSYAILYMALICISISFINPIEYKILILCTLIIPDLIFYYKIDAAYGGDIYVLLDTFIIAAGAVTINQFYAMDRYRIFALESKLKCDREIDGLTGLSNKRYFQEMMDDQYDARGLGCAILVDLDHFKQVNDTFGHKYGDDVLQKAAHILQSIFYDKDSLSRIGGDEFATFFATDVSTEQMVDVLSDKIHRLQKRTPIIVSKNKENVQVTFSIGIYIHEIDDDHTPQDILSEADAAMYQIKNSTRNGACLRYGEDSEIYIYPGEDAI